MKNIFFFFFFVYFIGVIKGQTQAVWYVDDVAVENNSYFFLRKNHTLKVGLSVVEGDSLQYYCTYYRFGFIMKDTGTEGYMGGGSNAESFPLFKAQKKDVHPVICLDPKCTNYYKKMLYNNNVQGYFFEITQLSLPDDAGWLQPIPHYTPQLLKIWFKK